MKPYYKHLMMLALLIATGWTTATALPTKMLTTAEAQAITYSWTDANGTSHDVNLAQTATNAYWIYDMIREVYTNPSVPGIWQATYEGPAYSSSYYTSFNAGLTDRPGTAYYLTDPDNATRGRDVYYGAIGEGWNITSAPQPSQEGYTMLFVALKDTYQDYCTAERLDADPYFTTKEEVIELIENTIDSVMLVTEGIRVNEGTTNAGAVFSVKGFFNRFFFMTKGRANDLSYGQDMYSAWRGKTSHTTAQGYPAADEHFGTMPLFNQMFEQFSPNDATIETDQTHVDLTDFYSSMVNGSTYNVKHDCNSVPYQHHAFSMAGSSANTHYTIAGLNIFIPDRRLETWYQESLTTDGTSWVWNDAYSPSDYTTKVLDGRTRWDGALWANAVGSGNTSTAPYWTLDSETGMYYTYENSVSYSGGTVEIGYPLQNSASTKYYFYNPKHYPKMNLYTVKLTAEAAPSTAAGMYTVTLNWTSSFNELVSDVPQKYWVYIVNADGSYELLTTTVGTTTYNYDVPMGDPFSYTINYIVMAQPVDAQGQTIFTETWSNQDNVEIPGTTTNERFRLLLVDNICHYTTVGELNNYDNRLRLQNIGITPANLVSGDNIFTFHRLAPDGSNHVFAKLNLNTAGGAHVPTIIASQSEIAMLKTVKTATFTVEGLYLEGDITLNCDNSAFALSHSTLTAANGSVPVTTITVTYSGSEAAEGNITLTSPGANAQTVKVTYSPYDQYTSATVDFSASTTRYYQGSTTTTQTGYGSWNFGTGSGQTDNAGHYMLYFPIAANGGAVTYTFPTDANVGTVDVTIDVDAYGTSQFGLGDLIVKGDQDASGTSFTYTSSMTKTNYCYSHTWTGVKVSRGGSITITSMGGSLANSSYAPDIVKIVVSNASRASMRAPRRLATPVTVTPSIRYYDENGTFTTATGYTTLNYSSKTYATNDTIDLYGVINYVNDEFSQYVGDNLHPAYYDYYATFNEDVESGGGDEPQPATPVLTVSPATVDIDGNEGTTGTFTVTGSDLTGNVTITAPAGFTVSPASITPSNGAVDQAVTITADGTATSGTITVASDGATSQTVDVTYTAPSQGGGGDYPYTLDFSGMTSGWTPIAVEEPWSSSYVYPSNGSAYISYNGYLKFTVPASGSVTVSITTASSNGSGYIKVGTSTQENKATANGGTYVWSLSNLNAGDVITINGANSKGTTNESPRIVSIVVSAQ